MIMLLVFLNFKTRSFKIDTNFSKINELPVHKETKKESIKTSFFSEKI